MWNLQFTESIARGPLSTVHRGFDARRPWRPLLLKVHAARLVSERWMAHCRQRIEHLRILEDPVLLPPVDCELQDGAFVVARDDFAGVPLSEHLRAEPRVPLRTFFSLAIQLAHAVERIHDAGALHGGLKPSNVLIQPDSLDVRVVDFVSPLDVREVSHFVYEPSFVTGTLPYTSPEQTGRINHRVDFSSDLYSLGAILFELLTGAPPFRSADPLALIHAHLAEPPPFAHERVADVPPALSRLVARLLVKEPEKRYQSGAGLRADLVRCRDEFLGSGVVTEFPLATADRGHRIQFVSKMVGREAEATAILAEYEQATQGSFRAAFISGLSGIGKTRLIQELQRPIVRHRGYFTSGKFDFYQRNLPYSSLLQAFRTLLRSFLTESDERVGHWRQRILAALGGNGRVLTDVLPELELLIGVQPVVAELPPVEARNRFSDVFLAFVTALASEESPITIFIDDLQWCDSASFDFLDGLFATTSEPRYLFFLAAYRHNEVDASHPLSRLLRRNRETARPMLELRLEPLRASDCHEMVSYILDSEPAETESLSQFLFALTEGNPLFVSEGLAYLHNESLLHRDSRSHWSWNLESIRRSQMPSSIVSLFGAKVRKLPTETIALLELAACSGNRVAPEFLAEVSARTLFELFEALRPALGQGLLVESKGQLQFIHDRVQEAVLASIEPDARRAIHARIGERLLGDSFDEVALEARDDLFAIVSHLSLGRGPSLGVEEAWRLSRLAYLAGCKALDALATAAANDYLRLSRELLPPDAWEREHDLAFRIYRKGAKAALICGEFSESERLLDALLDHARSDLDRAESLAEQTTSLSSVGDFEKAIATANRGLALFDKALPHDPAEAARRTAALMARIAADRRDVFDAILRMPFTHERRRKIELAFYSELIPDLYMSGMVPQLYLSAAQSTVDCLEGGMDESVIYSFSIMGLQLGEREEFEAAFRYEDLARELSARHPNTFGATRGINGVVWCNAHSRSHPEAIVRYCLTGIQSGKSCGDLYNAGLCYGPLMWNLAVQGDDLDVIAEYADECEKFAERYRLGFSSALSRAVFDGWVVPMRDGHAAEPTAEIAQWEQDRHVAAAGSYFVLRGITHYFLGEWPEAAAAFERVERYVLGLTDNVLKRQWFVFRILVALVQARVGDDVVERVGPLLAQVRRWSALGPLLRPYLALIEAEVARASGRIAEARNAYGDVVGQAQTQRYTLLAAHAHHRLSGLLEEAALGPHERHLREANHLYRQCGAAACARLIARELRPTPALAHPARNLVAREVPSSRGPSLPSLDIDYLMKSSRAISAETDPEALARRVMSVLLECSGAQHGFLFVEEHGRLTVGGEAHVTDVSSSLGRELDELEEVCRPFVRYVQRTRERLLFDDALEQSELRERPEVRRLAMKSVLCLPVLYQGGLTGVLYLENRLAAAVFTDAKILATELLTSQAAVSLKNARLVASMRKAEESLRTSLAETEMLLREVHHRVKNNLQVVTSLLRMQSDGLDDPRLRDILRTSQHRIDSMALVHEELHRSNHTGKVQMQAYFGSLLAKIGTGFGIERTGLELTSAIEPIALPVEAAIPCGLLVNEAVSNAVKHAFPAGNGTIAVALRRVASEVEIEIRDGGVGFTPPTNVRLVRTLGLQLIHALCSQLHAVVEIRSSTGGEHGGGTVVRARFSPGALTGGQR